MVRRNLKYTIILLILFSVIACSPEQNDKGFLIYYLHATVNTPRSETDCIMYKTDTLGNSYIALFDDTIYSSTGVRFDCSGEWVVYSDPFSYSVVLEKMDFSEKMNISAKEGSESPTISPYGDCIAFISRDEKNNMVLSVVFLKTEDTIFLSPEPDCYTQDEYPSFSPDGNKIVYSRVRTDEYRKIYTLDLRTEETTLLITAEGHATYPSYSPDGRYILYMAQVNGDDYQICRYNIGTDVVEILTNTGNNMYPSYSPDGKYIVFSSRRGNDEDLEIYIMKSDGTGLKRLTDNEYDDMYPVVYEKVSLPENNSPEIPYNPHPSDGEENVDRVIDFSWESSDPDGDRVYYDFYFGEDKENLSLVSKNMNINRNGVSGLSANTTYYWKIVARDIHGAESEGPVWKFKTGD